VAELDGRPEPRARLTVGDAPDGAVRIGLAGELDIASLPDVAGQLAGALARDPQPAEIDLSGLGFMDSSGVAVLIRLANHFQPVRTRQATPPVRRVLEVLGLADRLGLDGD
jgi:anti-anti-sigma factor